MTQLNFTLSIDGLAEDAFIVRNYQGHESLSDSQLENGEPCYGFRYHIELASRQMNYQALSAVEDTTPSDMAEFVADKTRNMYWNENTLISESFSNWSQIYFFIAGFAKVSLVIFLPVFYLVMIFGSLYASLSWDEVSATFWGLLLYGLIPCLLIYGHFMLVNAGHFYLAPFLRGRKVFELNRQTGMVTLFKNNNSVNFSHPFIEFDCVLMSAPTPQGQLNYNLALI